jgi:hypothetical protein
MQQRPHHFWVLLSKLSQQQLHHVGFTKLLDVLFADLSTATAAADQQRQQMAISAINVITSKMLLVPPAAVTFKCN